MAPNIPQGRPQRPEPAPFLFIFVNGRRYDEDSGVKAKMNYKEIAALDGVNDRQVVRRIFSGQAGELPPRDVGQDEIVSIEAGQRFTAEVKPFEDWEKPAAGPAPGTKFVGEVVGPAPAAPAAPTGRSTGVQAPHPMAPKPAPTQSIDQSQTNPQDPPAKADASRGHESVTDENEGATSPVANKTGRTGPATSKTHPIK